jgi:hypothetical protein
MPFPYIAYSLGISSNIPLPELISAEMAVDVRVREGDVDATLATTPTLSGGRIYAAPGEALCAWSGVGAFRIHEGSEIVVDPVPGVEERVLRLFLLGPVLALLLAQRGRLVLHGSAIAIEGSAIALLGESGAGKSSLAAAMYTHSYTTFCDDLTAVDMERTPPMLDAGFPRLGIMPDLAMALGYDPEHLLRLHPVMQKRALDVRDRFTTLPAPLRCIYVLGEGEEVELEALAPHDALVELLRHSYLASVLDAMDATSAHLRQCARLAGTVPVRRLRMKRSLDLLPEIVTKLDRDINEVLNGSPGPV